MKLISTVFKEGERIPAKHTCDGKNINPPLLWSNAPKGTQSFVLIMDDPDIPDFVKKSRGIEVFDHWLAYNIPPSVSGVKEGTEPEGIAGLNSAGKIGYTGPCPPDREHRYFFKIYALDTELDLPEGATKIEVENAMQGHILEQTELMGKYERQ